MFYNVNTKPGKSQCKTKKRQNSLSRATNLSFTSLCSITIVVIWAQLTLIHFKRWFTFWLRPHFVSNQYGWGVRWERPHHRFCPSLNQLGGRQLCLGIAPPLPDQLDLNFDSRPKNKRPSFLSSSLNVLCVLICCYSCFFKFTPGENKRIYIRQAFH